MHDSAKSSVQRADKFNKKTAFLCALIFVTAVGVRLMHWQDARSAFRFAGMGEGVDAQARVLLDGEVRLFLRGNNPPNEATVLWRPPGYPILVAAVYKAFGASDTVMRMFQILWDAAAAVLVFFIMAELLSARGAAFVAGLIVALSPQLASYSILLLPDSPVVLLILSAVFAIIKLSQRPRLMTAAATGALIGLSCWLRANTLLLAPFLAVLMILLGRRRQLATTRYAAVLVSVTLLFIAPITIRNIIVFGRFIPLQLGTGVTLLEGIADYDTENRSGLPSSDNGIVRMEAALYNRPDYLTRLFMPGGADLYNPDGIAREDARLARGLAVIREHPLWFSGTMIRRAASMLRIERPTAVAAEPAVTHLPHVPDGTPPVWSFSPAKLVTSGIALSPRTRVSAHDDALRIEGDSSRWGDQFALPLVPVEKNTDYLFRMPIKVERGGVALKVVSMNLNTVLASSDVWQWAETPANEQPVSVMQIDFVSRDTSQLRVVVGNINVKNTGPVAEVGRVEVFRLGAAAHLWTRFPRLLVRSAQKFFVTALLLPLMIVGLILLLRARQRRAAVIILAIPVYYMCFQSALHTEFRYVLAVHYFTFMLVAVALTWIGERMWQYACRRSDRLLTFTASTAQPAAQ